jgi:hypothetical protein
MLAGYALVASGLPLPLGVDLGPRSAAAAKRLAGKDRSRPFPCSDKPCGCATAEQCFSKCCCHTPAETLAWARARGIDPAMIATLQRRVAEPPEKPAGESCCSAKNRAGRHSTPDDPGCCAEVEAVASSTTPLVPEVCGEFAALAARPEKPEGRRAIAPVAAQETESVGVEPASSQTVVLKALLACGGSVSQWLSLGGAAPPPVVVAVVSVAPLVEAILPGDSVFSCGRAAPDAPPPRVA